MVFCFYGRFFCVFTAQFPCFYVIRPKREKDVEFMYISSNTKRLKKVEKGGKRVERVKCSYLYFKIREFFKILLIILADQEGFDSDLDLTIPNRIHHSTEQQNNEKKSPVELRTATPFIKAVAPGTQNKRNKLKLCYNNTKRRTNNTH